MTRIGATIRMGPAGPTLALGGHTWALADLDSGKRAALARMLSDTLGLRAPKGPRTAPASDRNSK